jgi:hypothetical protein
MATDNKYNKPNINKDIIKKIIKPQNKNLDDVKITKLENKKIYLDADAV